VIARGFFGEGATAEIPVNIQLAGWVVLVAKALSVADPVIQTIVRFT
jgi:Na+/serine symporter